MIIFENTFPTEKTCKERIINAIKDSLLNLHLVPKIDEKEFNLILDEAIINAMEHGNRWNPEKEIMISLRHSGDSAELIIGDQGDGFNHQTNCEKSLEEKFTDIRGRGILLIKKLSQSEWLENGSIIRINIPLNSPNIF